MTNEEAFKTVYQSVQKVMGNGFVMTGELHISIPRTPGLIKIVAEASINPELVRLTLKPEKGDGVSPSQASILPIPLTGGEIVGPSGPELSVAMRALSEEFKDQHLEGHTHSKIGLNQVSSRGEICSKCGGHDIQYTGTCGRCLNCGESTGCS